MVTNEYPNKEKLAIGLAQLGMRKLFKKSTGQKGAAMHFKGRNHIGGIWDTKDVNCHKEIFLPLWS